MPHCHLFLGFPLQLKTGNTADPMPGLLHVAEAGHITRLHLQFQVEVLRLQINQNKK